jgi:hypothetical protein
MAKKRGSGCVRKKIVIKKRSGKVVASFMGRQGSGCGPRPKPKTGHLRHYKAAFKSAVKACKKQSHARKGKRGRSAFNNCISTHMPK